MKRELDTSLESDQRYAANVVDWLNGRDRAQDRKNTKASRNRVLAAFTLIRATLNEIATAPSWDLINYPTPELDKCLEDLNDVLAIYVTSPFFYINFGREWLFEEIVSSTVRHPAGESVAIHSLIGLTKAKRLDRIRECICNRWFFAKREDQKSCSPRCRHKNSTNRPVNSKPSAVSICANITD